MMITCEKCGELFNREEITAFQVSLRPRKKGQPPEQRPLDLCKETCAHLWEKTAPGDWVSISGEEVQRLYWPCDHCGEVCRFDGVKVMVQLMQMPPRTESIICEDCEKKLTQDDNPRQWTQWTPGTEAQDEPDPAAQELEPGPAAVPIIPTTAQKEAEESHAAPAVQQSGWQVAVHLVQAAVETVVETARRLRGEEFN